MALTENQKQINDDPRYWQWFEDWWKEDYSWDGLESKSNLSGEPLKAAYTRYNQETDLVEVFGRKWHPLNLPQHNLSGVLTDQELVKAAKAKAKAQLNEIEEIHGCVWPSNSFSGLKSDKLVKCFYCLTSGFKNNSLGSGGSNRHLIYANNCYVDLLSSFSAHYDKSIIVSAEIACRSFDAQIREDLPSELIFDNCTLQRKTEIKVYDGISVSIVGSDTDQLEIHGANMRLHNLNAHFINLHITQGDGYIETAEYNYDCEISLERTSQAFITITGNKKHSHPEGRVAVDLGPDNNLHLCNVEVSNFILNCNTLGLLQIENSTIHTQIELRDKAFDRLVLKNSLFSNGIFAENFSTGYLCKMEGITSLKLTHFVSSDFGFGLECTSFENLDGTTITSKLSNVNFTDSKFRRSMESGYSCVTFTNTEFRGHAIFDEVEFDGVPRFHDTTLPKDTSFDHLKENSDFIKVPLAEDQMEKYGHYQRAFRSLRQLMENNNNSASAYTFGRLELMSKLKRGVTNEVKKEELCFNRWYGNLADYGQDFVRPVWFLLFAYISSLLWQFFVFTIAESECLLWKSGCRINGDVAGEAFERGTVFSLPPFTMLTNRSIDESSQQAFSWYTDLFSGFGMICHAVAATLLLFLFALSVKRKMQIK